MCFGCSDLQGVITKLLSGTTNLHAAKYYNDAVLTTNVYVMPYDKEWKRQWTCRQTDY